MLPRIILPTVVLLLAALAAPAPAQDLEGEFRASIRDFADGDEVELRLDGRRLEHWTVQLDRARLDGLPTTGEAGQAIRFTLAGDAGHMEFEGEWMRRRRVEGAFTFTEASAYRDHLEDMGYRRVDEDEVLSALVLDVDREWIDLVADWEGRRRPKWDHVIALRVHGATAEYFDAMADAGLDLDLEDLIAFRVHDISPDYVASMRGHFGRRVDAQDLLAARIHGVTEEYVAELAELGYDDADLDDLVACRIHGVDARFAKRMHRRGYEDASLQDLVAMRIHGRH